MRLILVETGLFQEAGLLAGLLWHLQAFLLPLLWKNCHKIIDEFAQEIYPPNKSFSPRFSASTWTDLECATFKLVFCVLLLKKNVWRPTKLLKTFLLTLRGGGWGGGGGVLFELLFGYEFEAIC